ncbi:hypothetical protein [uncultured Pontibacter sp.]|uniref:hypothetical protein n=1 Tax=uncultured Pontibacter sp. TaxID=453356 RepID=UPI00262893C5|nr:hypothetical protein [uncultured Pontibacter sp.]
MGIEHSKTTGATETSLKVEQHGAYIPYDSSRWKPCVSFNYNHIYFNNLKEREDYVGEEEDYVVYESGHIKNGFQLLYLEKPVSKVKAVNFDTLYIFAIERYELDKYNDGYTIYFRCRDSLDIYTLFHPDELEYSSQVDFDEYKYQNLAWKNITTEDEIKQKPKGWTRIYNTRITKLAKLGF